MKQHLVDGLMWILLDGTYQRRKYSLRTDRLGGVPKPVPEYDQDTEMLVETLGSDVPSLITTKETLDDRSRVPS